MTLREDILEAQKKAMKEKDEDRLRVLRLLNAALKNAEIDAGGALADATVQQVVQRQVKQLQDALTDFTTAGRTDLMDQTKKEIEIMSVYLPQQLGDEELEKIVATVVQEMSAAGAADMGKVMGAAMKQVNGRADGNRVRATVQRLLSG